MNKKNTRKALPIQRTAREWALQLLYQLDMGEEELCETIIEEFQNQVLDLNHDVGDKEGIKIKKISLRLVKASWKS